FGQSSWRTEMGPFLLYALVVAVMSHCFFRPPALALLVSCPTAALLFQVVSGRSLSSRRHLPGGSFRPSWRLACVSSFAETDGQWRSSLSDKLAIGWPL